MKIGGILTKEDKILYIPIGTNKYQYSLKLKEREK